MSKSDRVYTVGGPAMPRMAGYAIGPAFLLLAVFFAVGPNMLDLPRNDSANGVLSAADSRRLVSSEPLRGLPSGEPVVLRGGYELGCMECHRLWVSPVETPPSPHQLRQHQEIVLEHGINARCYNCHDRFQRDRLVLPDGALIGFDESPRLCATCHGTVYRDWEHGMHGRTTGSWDALRPEHRRLQCIECHDPHAPAFGAMNLLAGPNTLRMPEKKDDAHDHHYPPRKHNPLRQWKHVLNDDDGEDR